MERFVIIVNGLRYVSFSDFPVTPFFPWILIIFWMNQDRYNYIKYFSCYLAYLQSKNIHSMVYMKELCWGNNWLDCTQLNPNIATFDNEFFYHHFGVLN